MYVGIHAHGVRPHVMTHISAHLHLQPSRGEILCLCTHACMRASSSVHMYIYILVCMHTCIYMYAYVFFGEYKFAPIYAL